MCSVCKAVSSDLAVTAELTKADAALAKRGLELSVGHFQVSQDWWARAQDKDGNTVLYTDDHSSPLKAVAELLRQFEEEEPCRSRT